MLKCNDAFCQPYNKDDICEFIKVHSALCKEANEELLHWGFQLPTKITNPLKHKNFFSFCQYCKDKRLKLRSGEFNPLDIFVSSVYNQYTDTVSAWAKAQIYLIVNSVLSFPLKYPDSPKELGEKCIRNFHTFNRTHDFSFSPLIAREMKRVIERWMEGIDLSIFPCTFGPGITNCTSSDRTEKYRKFYSIMIPYDSKNQRNLTGLKCDPIMFLPVDGNKQVSIEASKYFMKPQPVPKTVFAMRVIGPEGPYLSWYQAGIRRVLYRHIQNHPYLRTRIKLWDQTLNQDKARIGSKTGAYATVDLSSASDSIGKNLIEYLFQDTAIWPYLAYSRAPYVEVSPGHYETLNLWGGMGNGDTFALESLVFAALYEVLTGTDWYVYGDDGICRSEYFADVKLGFALMGFAVNSEKSYNNIYKESCGKEYLYGYDVTGLYFRVSHCSSPVDVKNYQSWIALINQLRQRRFWKTACYVEQTFLHKKVDLGLFNKKGKNGKVLYKNNKPQKVHKYISKWTPLYQNDDITRSDAIYYPPDMDLPNKQRIKCVDGKLTWLKEAYALTVVPKTAKELGSVPTMQPVYDWLADKEFTQVSQELDSLPYRRLEVCLKQTWVNIPS